MKARSFETTEEKMQAIIEEEKRREERFVYPKEIFPEWEDMTKEPPRSIGFWFGKESREALPDHKEIGGYMKTLKKALERHGLMLSDADVDILSSKLFVIYELTCHMCGEKHLALVEEHIARVEFQGGICMYPGLVCINGKCPHEHYDEDIHQYVDSFAIRNNVKRIQKAIKKGLVFAHDHQDFRDEAVKGQLKAEREEVEYRNKKKISSLFCG